MIVRYIMEARDYSYQTEKGDFTITETYTQEMARKIERSDRFPELERSRDILLAS